jgi:vancomycin permeability regulator SanA
MQEPPFADRRAPPYEVIIVLGAAVWPDGQPSPALRSRVAHAVRLFHAGHGQRLLMTGGLGKHPPAEARLMRQLALAAGVPDVAILVEEQAVSTLQSAAYCAPIVQQHGWSAALLVTDCYHLPRAVLTFRHFGVRAHGSAPPERPYARRRWKQWRYRLREVLACVWYVIRLTVRRSPP